MGRAFCRHRDLHAILARVPGTTHVIRTWHWNTQPNVLPAISNSKSAGNERSGAALTDKSYLPYIRFYSPVTTKHDLSEIIF